MDDNIIDRRKFFKISLATGGALAAGFGVVGCSNEEQTKDVHVSTHNHHTTPNDESDKAARGRMFFQTDRDFKNLSAACERIYPHDEHSLGAIELKVPYFIDNQLAGAYGLNAREYMQGPFFEGKAEQGYQSPLLRKEIFLLGLEALEHESLVRYQKSFFALDATIQDELLKEFEADKVQIQGLSSQYFFTLLRDLTLAGALADPIYGGNKNKMGWKAMSYPGAQMSYLDKISSDEFFNIEPLSLADMQ